MKDVRTSDISDQFDFADHLPHSQQLKRHMQRHCVVIKKPRKAGSSGSSIFAGPNLRLRWWLQETEVYSKLFYDERIEPVVRDRLNNMGPQDKAISIVKSVTKELWDAEDMETKAAVAAKVAKAQDVAIENEPDNDSVRTPREYQK